MPRFDSRTRSSRVAGCSAKNGRATLALLLGTVLFAASCSSSPSVDAAAEDEKFDSASSAIDGEEETTDVEVGESQAPDEDDGAAMGEDDGAMGEDGGDAGETADESSDTDDAGANETTTLDSAELAAALEVGESNRFSLPFLYLTVDQDCEGCAETMSLYYVPGQPKASILTLEGAYINGVAQADFSAVDPLLQAGDPRRVAEQLAELPGATYGVDPASGLITSWTVDGASVTMRCLQMDTRPVDMRSELCEGSRIG